MTGYRIWHDHHFTAVLMVLVRTIGMPCVQQWLLLLTSSFTNVADEQLSSTLLYMSQFVCAKHAMRLIVHTYATFVVSVT